MYEYRVVLKRIIDGDSAIIDVDLGFNVWKRNFGFRLFGWQAPEMRTTDPDEKAVAQRATDIINKLFTEGHDYLLISEKDATGKYGRALGDLISRDPGVPTSWAQTLSRAGLVVPYGTPKAEEMNHWRKMNADSRRANDEGPGGHAENAGMGSVGQDGG